MAGASATWDRTTTWLKFELLQSTWLQAGAVGVAMSYVYWLTAKSGNPFNQYVRLADSFLNGRLHLVFPGGPPALEVVYIGEKAFVIDPPAPTLFLMPVVALWGSDINQVLVSVAVGAAAMGLFWVAARQMGWNLQLTAAITLLLGLGTNFWWASTDGALWSFAHVSAVFFLMAALVEGTGKKRPWLVGLLVGLAGMSRLPTFLTFPFFAFLILDDGERPWGEVLRANWLRLGLFGTGLGIMALSSLAYNYGRFGTWRDEGFLAPYYLTEPWFAEGRFDVSYIPRHIEGIFFMQPVLTESTFPHLSSFPYLRPTTVGMGLFFTTPAFLYAFNTRINRLTLAAIAAILLTLVPLMMHGSIGWHQFGYRFSLDLFPMLAILTAAGMRHQMTPLKWGIILLSVLISLWGPLQFHKGF